MDDLLLVLWIFIHIVGGILEKRFCKYISGGYFSLIFCIFFSTTWSIFGCKQKQVTNNRGAASVSSQQVYNRVRNWRALTTNDTSGELNGGGVGCREITSSPLSDQPDRPMDTY